MKKASQEWLLVFYSVPAHPVSGRMKIWRKLAKAGAVQLKGAVYILPVSADNEEFFQWLVGEVKSLGGDGIIVKSADVRTMADADIRTLFITQVDQEYRRFEKELDSYERKVQSIRKSESGGENRELSDRIARMLKEFEEIGRRDFFGSPNGTVLKKRVAALVSSLRDAGKRELVAAPRIVPRNTGDFQGKVWVTRKNPFVDRMASAWLIRKFIDRSADFKFIEEREIGSIDKQAVTFDMRGAAFTHVGDLCTFEVLVRSFRIKDKTVRKLAEIVHDLDVKDDKYGKPETTGIEDILAGIRKTAKNDADGLERGMAAFEMLYQSKS